MFNYGEENAAPRVNEISDVNVITRRLTYDHIENVHNIYNVYQAKGIVTDVIKTIDRTETIQVKYEKFITYGES